MWPDPKQGLIISILHGQHFRPPNVLTQWSAEHKERDIFIGPEGNLLHFTYNLVGSMI